MTTSGSDTSVKSRKILSILAFPVPGILGSHRFYTGKYISAAIMLALSALSISVFWSALGYIPLAVVGVWSLIDFNMSVSGVFFDSEGKTVKNW